jgi:hypothetical protein
LVGVNYRKFGPLLRGKRNERDPPYFPPTTFTHIFVIFKINLG